MLYSTIPPILIVTSLVGIIIFLVKKAPKIALLEKVNADNKEANSKKSFFGKFKRQNGENSNIDFKHRLLLLLEKITRKLKLLFLKLENFFNVWSETIKQKRRFRESRGKFSDLVSKKEGRILDNSDGARDNKNQDILIENEESVNEKENEKIIEKKDIFEKILIERIAANPKDVEAYERLGEYYFEIENWNYAKECFKQVIKLNPNNVNIKAKMRKLGRLLSK